MLKHSIQFRDKGWRTEELARRLWHLLLGDDRTPEDQRVWRTSSSPTASWSLSDNNWHVSWAAHDDVTGLDTYLLYHRYGYEDEQMRALAKTLEMVLGVREATVQ